MVLQSWEFHDEQRDDQQPKSFLHCSRTSLDLVLTTRRSNRLSSRLQIWSKFYSFSFTTNDPWCNSHCYCQCDGPTIFNIHRKLRRCRFESFNFDCNSFQLLRPTTCTICFLEISSLDFEILQSSDYCGHSLLIFQSDYGNPSYICCTTLVRYLLWLCCKPTMWSLHC